MHTEKEAKINPSGFRDSLEHENTGEMKFYSVARKHKEKQNEQHKKYHNQGTQSYAYEGNGQA